MVTLVNPVIPVLMEQVEQVVEQVLLFLALFMVLAVLED
jgi:hypothetical protein